MSKLKQKLNKLRENRTKKSSKFKLTTTIRFQLIFFLSSATDTFGGRAASLRIGCKGMPAADSIIYTPCVFIRK